VPSQTGNAGEFLTTDGTNASWAEISASPTLEATASGTLANGDLIIINADGTVSAVLENSATYNKGADSIFEYGTTAFTASAYDSASNKIVVAYMDDSSGSSGTAVVGTVSGETISFGTPVQFKPSVYTDRIAVAFDSSANKVLIAYRASAQAKLSLEQLAEQVLALALKKLFLQRRLLSKHLFLIQSQIVSLYFMRMETTLVILLVELQRLAGQVLALEAL
jgi:hypothetical protein